MTVGKVIQTLPLEETHDLGPKELPFLKGATMLLQCYLTVDVSHMLA